MAGKSNRTIGIFIDRDGTIIEDKGYLADSEQVEFVPNAIPALKLLAKNGFKLFVTTNQSGVARKLVTLEQLEQIHNRMVGVLSLNGIRFDQIYFCPHHPEDNCSCRKPRPGMALKAKKSFSVDLDRSYSIGDKLSDASFGKNFGGKGILVMTGIKDKGDLKTSDSAYIAKDLEDAAKWIIKDSQNGDKDEK